jgi:hypothetical protein
VCFPPTGISKDVGFSPVNQHLRGALQSVAGLGLCVELTSAHRIRSNNFCYLSIDMHCILFYVKFENGLCISALRKRVASLRKQELETEKFLKKTLQFFKGRHQYGFLQCAKACSQA